MAKFSKLLSRVDAYFKCWGISFRAEAAGPNLNKTFQFDLTSFLDDFVAKLAECQKTLFSSGMVCECGLCIAGHLF